ncbi:MAG TPA: phospholipase D-like domain-containing protein [Steroidobacteraceae bacterium]|nr:phospholipase D-like domain-containing protein [Steroidobacteraceae bacterium]
MMLDLHTAYEVFNTWFVLVLSLACATFASLHALLTKPDPKSAFGWIAVCWLVPLGGAILYGLFGINRVRARARQLRGPAGAARSPPRITQDASANHLMRVGDAVTQWPRVAGNALEALENGENAFPAMLEAIAGAGRSVWLATYIFETDAVGRKFIDALAAAAARGVQVRVLVDGVGEWYSWPRAVSELRRAGVRARRFLPPRLVPPRLSLNMRNHRKLLLVDGKVGFLGGMNIGGREVGRAGVRRMADLHFKVRGPVLQQLGEAFRIDWLFSARETLSVPEAPPASGECTCRVITEGPDEDNDKLVSVMLAAVSLAREQLLMMTPYFIPPPELVSALQSAALRGVDVTLVLPERSNLRYVDWASTRWLQPLVERGVQVLLQPPPFAHTKLLVMDGCYAQVGSANLDSRSLRLNFEIALEIHDAATCRRLGAYVIEARDRSKPLTAPMLGALTLPARVRNSLFWLLSPYL